jgi:hypothetical protein
MDSRYALSRNEEEGLLKRMKADALKTCATVVGGEIHSIPHTPSPFIVGKNGANRSWIIDFTECAAGRTVSVVWACRPQFAAMKACMAVQ